MGYAFLVDAETFAWLLPIAVSGLPACLAIFTALGFAGARLLWTRGPARILAFAVALTAAEWLRGHALTGLPWNAFGYALTSPLELAQTASLVGIWGLTFIAVAAFASPAALTDDRSDTARPWLPVLAAFVVLAALALFGSLRLSRAPTSLVDGLWSGTPSIAVDYRGGDYVDVNPVTLQERDDGLVASRLGNLLL